MADARAKLLAARVGLVLDEPFFGTLALGLALREDVGCGTAWTDGRTLGYDPAFIDRLSHDQVKALVAHEVMHCAAGHVWRRDGRTMARWNLAADKVINTTLREAGFSLPQGAYYAEGEEVGKSAEWVYARLPEQPGKGQGKGQGQGKGAGKGQKGQGGGKAPQGGASGDGAGSEFDGGALGEFRDAPQTMDADGSPAPSDAEWKQAVAQAAQQAKMCGKLPGSLERLVQQALAPKVDWRSVLRRFMERATSDYSWTMPNRRFIAGGIYMPSLLSHDMPEVAVAVDTSGSIDDVALAAFQAEVVAVIGETNPAAVTVYYADARVARCDRFERGEMLVWHPAGGGGTDFRPVFKAVEGQDVPPSCIIYLTDLCGTFPEVEPDVPTLWVTADDERAPWGETVKMEAGA